MAATDAELFVEPSGEAERAGLRSWQRELTHYQRFMAEEGVPVYPGIGFHDVRELELGDWPRMGGRGAFLYLDGLEGIKGMYVLEIPGGAAINAERHLYHEFYLVLEGRGTTETWLTGSERRQITEWQPGSLFYLPPNVNHRLINATNERVMIIATTNAPGLWNLLRDRNFIFENDYPFPQHYSEDADFYKFDDTLYATRNNKRAQKRTNYYPDVINCELPLDNQRVPGYRRIQPQYRGFENEGGFISQYPPGRYSRAHYHGAGAVLVCLRGHGYSYNWLRDYGTTPWADGNGDKVRMIAYKQGGLVAAAPGGGNWFHQHFNVSREHFRVINYWGGPTSGVQRAGASEEDLAHGGVQVSGNLNIREGGHSIAYSEEDPYVREYYESELSKEGLKSDMAEELYQSD